ncbi:MAG: sirohydrochlorin cobaltochelatase [Lachnospiraceae bacterium]|nr:sirohydrochlorin cobaltochelatase [Lachnospiraceae bacterium]
MNKLKKRILALGVALVVALTSIPMFGSLAFADEAATAKVYMTISFKGELAKANDGSPMTWKEVTVTDLNEDGAFSYHEALVAAHTAYNSADGYAAATSEYGAYVTKLWGEETSNTLFFLNDVPIKTDVETDKVADGDYLLASVNADSAYYSDFYTTFGAPVKKAYAGDVEVMLTGYMGMGLTPDASAIAGASLGYYTEDGTFVDLNKTTDAEGKATISFSEPGTYYLTASGSVTGTLVTHWGIYSLAYDGGAPFGWMDYDTLESEIAYTEKDYGPGPYPADEVKYMDFYDWNELTDEELKTVHALASNQLITTSPIIAPCTAVVVKAVPSIEVVRTEIQALSADPSTFKAEDKEAVEEIWADFQALSAEDQAILDDECTHSGTGQPLGRVLESALWAIWSYEEVDNSTTLMDGVYTKTSEPAISSTSDKGKSTSSRVRTWTVTQIVVEDGKVTADLSVDSSSYPKVWIGGVEYEKQNTSGKTSDFTGIPIDLNSTFYIGGVSSSMPTPIMYAVTTEIEEPAPIDLTITNENTMFKVAKAVQSGSFVTFTMNSTAYDCLFVGHSEEAEEASEEDLIPIGSDKVFKLKVDDFSEPLLLSFHSKKNDAFYNRTFVFDLEAKTLVTGDYKEPVGEIENMTLEEALAKKDELATVPMVNSLIRAIKVQYRDENTDKYCAVARAYYDALTDEEKDALIDPGYFGDDTGDASKDDPRNQDNIGEKELLVVSFGTSFNGSRVATIKAVEDALAAAYPEYAVRRAFTAQIIINHVQARDGEAIDNMKQALDRAVANNVKELVIQPTHLMHGAEYDEMCEELEAYEDKFDKIIISEPLLNTEADKTTVAKAVVDAAVAASDYDTLDAADAAKTAFVFMGHGTEHQANVTYTEMQAIFDGLNYKNVFVGTVEGLPESTEVNAVLAKVQAAGYEKVILRPLMVVAGDHANNDMADIEDEESWASIFGEALGAANVTCQINGLGEIAAVQQVYVAHVGDALHKDAIAIKDGIYKLPELKAGPSAMFNHFEADSRFLIVDGDTATIRFITDASTASIQKYSRIALGKSSELLTDNYQPDSALPAGTVIINGKLQPKISGEKYLFEITIAKEEAEELLANDVEDDIYVTIWNKEGSSEQKVPGWYKPSKDIYLSLGTLGEEDEIPALTELAITNTTNMFKAVSASLFEEDEKTYLVMALSGSGYHELFKGTYEQAVANGDNTDNWIHGYQNADGKWEFVIPVEEGESYMPLVAVSNSYYEKYLNGVNPIARAFYPRQVVLDVNAKTLVAGDYQATADLAITNNVKMFTLDSAQMSTTGGPNSNGYQVEGIVTMGSTSFSKVFIGFADEAAAAADEDIITLGDDVTWTIDLEHIVTPGNPETTVSILDKPTYISFFSVKKQTWYERVFTFSKKDGTLVIDPSAADQISALPAAEDLTLEDADTVMAAQAAYDALPESEKALIGESVKKDLQLAVTTIEKLEAEAQVEEQEETISDLNKALEEIQKQIEELKEQLAKTPGWHTNEDGTKYFCNADGEKAKGWLKDGGNWYFMDKETGIMQTGWLKDGSWYFLDKDTGVMKTGWVKDGDTWYYMNTSGAMQTGWVKVGSSWYFMKSSGAMAANEWCEGYWLNANGTWTYQYKGSWKKDSKGWWFGDTSGWYAKNTTQKIDGENYKFDASGYWVQ